MQALAPMDTVWHGVVFLLFGVITMIMHVYECHSNVAFCSSQEANTAQTFKTCVTMCDLKTSTADESLSGSFRMTDMCEN